MSTTKSVQTETAHLKPYIAVLRQYGYRPVGLGWKNAVDDGGIVTVHWVTLFSRVGQLVKIQLYSYTNDETTDHDGYNYTTGVVEMSPEDLRIFIIVLTK